MSSYKSIVVFSLLLMGLVANFRNVAGDNSMVSHSPEQSIAAQLDAGTNQPYPHRGSGR
jgi:hypothetical protein